MSIDQHILRRAKAERRYSSDQSLRRHDRLDTLLPRLRLHAAPYLTPPHPWAALTIRDSIGPWSMYMKLSWAAYVRAEDSTLLIYKKQATLVGYS